MREILIKFATWLLNEGNITKPHKDFYIDEFLKKNTLSIYYEYPEFKPPKPGMYLVVYIGYEGDRPKNRYDTSYFDHNGFRTQRIIAWAYIPKYPQGGGTKL